MRSLSELELREIVLSRMGPAAEGRYPEGAVKALDEYIASVGARWQRVEGTKVRERAERAIRDAIEALARQS